MLNSVPLVIAQHSTQDDTSLLNSIGNKWGFPVVSHSEKPAEGFYLQIQNGVLGLADASEKKVLPVEVDFASPASLYRKQHGGGRKEPIVKAIGLKGNEGWHVVDATPGLGRDAFVLVSVGCKVTMIERSPIVAALLEDGIRRLALSFPELAAKMSLQHGNSAEVMQYFTGENVNAIYLDPMFPHKKKSALVKKEMRLFQQLLGHDPDADALLPPALKLATHRVVVKRPNSADVLAGEKPSMAIESKKHRFDVYLCQKP
ncbi:16S rRNA methyltransferase [Alteromonas mediterranea]|jgi:16S rRNA (guanine1516-N2)-methyltransferase|uniref:Ribosomal RNA small subunit methyltransferase J n=2 Tax=Alteromonas mediterranea TaxID=314275 RepID=RSMJ_ALTMD|nr:class I SAM-dependent methyltransferase [Alteromonas mediterranea]B4S2X7.1 RecName: Full=Ribosomal RNA small subunit methyltransferase J; AltName: Full=16S rRNA m2G1516 methyltransferase; AltName: Full=rRNA (guanine-N(2)-)-methyltransferase [Alteromonas mediterranea DE]MBR9895322.1 ribosomal RNA small subunit methyltransferase J [Gammaproteobacteria bacterium]MEA3379558.1 class I SAM-dependent methyltransferase [Pseudomonadota bacterium]AEA96307.1 16S rRNA methyltransferase [Alteromonas medi|tara:strand:- start:2067 stop:2843 length:777 start_codon:yes stop_codon:yes gene_type:complete